jgi:hypothetical protein
MYFAALVRYLLLPQREGSDSLRHPIAILRAPHVRNRETLLKGDLRNLEVLIKDLEQLELFPPPPSPSTGVFVCG